MPVIRIEIPPELLSTRDEEVVIRVQAVGHQPQTENTENQGATFLHFMETVIAGLHTSGQIRTAETYESARNSLRMFLRGKDRRLEDIDSLLMENYEAWLKKKCLHLNTISFYMRILRAAYNRAIERLSLPDNKPFRHVYTGVERTQKRAITVETLRNMLHFVHKTTPQKRFAIDMFFFSFYTRGMAFVDMAHLKTSDIVDGTLFYQRKKTGQRLCIRCEPALLDIVCRYHQQGSPYALPIIVNDREPVERQYRRCQRRVNRHLKSIGRQMGLPFPLTTYVARHSWATIARDLNVPLSVISEGMGHTSERTTRIYLASINTEVIDQANRSVINAVIKPDG